MQPDLTSPLVFLSVTMFIFLLIVGRYFLIAGFFHLWFYRWRKDKWKQRKLFQRGEDPQQFRKEVKWSMITATIFSFAGAAGVLLWQKGYTSIYNDVALYPLWWLPLSLLVAMFIHETYYYWIHRWMHIPSIFRIVHRVHHDSHITSPWTAFSFHPLEGLLQAIILPVICMVIPMHLHVLILMLTIMTLSSVVNHLGVEIYPSWMHRYALGRLLIGATHHSLHHKQYKYNFGLYFTFWDRWGKTESPVYHRTFQDVTEKNSVTP